MLPSDLLMRSPLKNTQPWPKTCPGSGSFALMSIAGQITQWNRVMSLPTMWRLAGHRDWNCAWSQPRPTAAA